MTLWDLERGSRGCSQIGTHRNPKSRYASWACTFAANTSQPAVVIRGPDPERQVAELERRCARAGLPVTAQRRTVLEVLSTRSDHPTVDQLYQAVAERLPDVSRATVYRALETLEALGLLQRVDHPGSSVRFDGNTEPHHHFHCTRCGTIEDLPMSAVRGSDGLAFIGADGRVIGEIAVQVRGLCAHCAGATVD